MFHEQVINFCVKNLIFLNGAVNFTGNACLRQGEHWRLLIVNCGLDFSFDEIIIFRCITQFCKGRFLFLGFFMMSLTRTSMSSAIDNKVKNNCRTKSFYLHTGLALKNIISYWGSYEISFQPKIHQFGCFSNEI